MKNKIHIITISERENMDVAWLMAFAAEKDTVDPWTSNLLKRASRLLRETTGFCTTIMHGLEHSRKHPAEERLLKAIFEGGNNNDDLDDETD